MNVEIHTLSWDNNDPRMIEQHQKVFDHFLVPISYTFGNYPHGLWMDAVLRKSKADIVGFIDSDCIIFDRFAIENALDYVVNSGTFIGLAQASNHIKPCSHIFAAPSFFFINRECWNSLGQPSFTENPRSDVAQEVSYVAEERGIRYRALYPIGFDAEPVEGVWRLGNFGLYGIGTQFESGVYHLYQGRYRKNVDLFVERCEEIVRGYIRGPVHLSDNFNYPGRIVP